MNRQITITVEPINEATLLAGRSLSSGMGAVVNFLGFVRGSEEGKTISAIEYEAFEKMVVHQFNLLFDELLHGHMWSENELKEIIGHTPLEVIGGIILGLLVAIVQWLIWK